MKRVACVLGVLALLATAASADNIAFWNFNNATNAYNNSLWQINDFGTDATGHLEYHRDLGVGSAEISAWSTDDASEGNLFGTNGGGTVPNFGGFAGTTLNDIDVPQASGDSFCPVGSGNNGRYFLIELDDAIQGAVLSYATRGTGTGFSTHQIDYSTDNGLNWAAMETITGRTNTTFSVQTVSFDDVFMNTSGHESNLIRITVSGATGTNGNNRFDNVLITGTIVPEPTSLLLLGLGAVALLRRR